jgi:hypothetical protein
MRFDCRRFHAEQPAALKFSIDLSPRAADPSTDTDSAAVLRVRSCLLRRFAAALFRHTFHEGSTLATHEVGYGP